MRATTFIAQVAERQDDLCILNLHGGTQITAKVAQQHPVAYVPAEPGDRVECRSMSGVTYVIRRTI